MTNNGIKEGSKAICINRYQHLLGHTVFVMQIKNNDIILIHDIILHSYYYVRREFFIPIEQWELDNP